MHRNKGESPQRFAMLGRAEMSDFAALVRRAPQQILMPTILLDRVARSSTPNGHPYRQSGSNMTRTTSSNIQICGSKSVRTRRTSGQSRRMAG